MRWQLDFNLKGFCFFVGGLFMGKSVFFLLNMTAGFLLIITNVAQASLSCYEGFYQKSIESKILKGIRFDSDDFTSGELKKMKEYFANLDETQRSYFHAYLAKFGYRQHVIASAAPVQDRYTEKGWYVYGSKSLFKKNLLLNGSILNAIKLELLLTSLFNVNVAISPSELPSNMDWDSILEFFSVNQAPIRRYLRALNVDRIWTSSHKSSLYVHSYYGRGGVELEGTSLSISFTDSVRDLIPNKGFRLKKQLEHLEKLFPTANNAAVVETGITIKKSFISNN